MNGKVFDHLKLDVKASDFQEMIHGMTLSAVVNLTIDHYKLTEIGHNELEHIWRVTAETAYSESDFIAGAPNYIEYLHSHGVKIGIATASPVSLIEAFFGRFPETRNKISCIVSCDDVGKNKPDPAVFLECMRRLGCTDASKAAIFEDSLTGLIGAKAANCKYVVQLMTGEDSERVRDAASPFVSLKDYSELLQ